MSIEINDYDKSDHFRAISEDDYSVSRTCEFEKTQMHHIHNTCEILFVEEGVAEYFIGDRKYRIEPFDILIIGAQEYHMRRIVELPYLRYGLTIKPLYYKNILLDKDLMRVFQTPSVENFEYYYKRIDPIVFKKLLALINALKEEKVNGPFALRMQKTLIMQISILLFRVLGLKPIEQVETVANEKMLEIKHYIDTSFAEPLNLDSLSKRFYLHPATISKEFSKCCGYNLNKYIHIVRICEAVRLLERNNESITIIAEKCGYDSVNTFLRQFKAIMQISPLQYRKSIRILYK